MPSTSEPITICLDKILLATDFSIASERATEYARALALRYDSTLELLHVLETSAPPLRDSVLADGAPEERAGIAREVLGRAQSWIEKSGVTVKTVCLNGRRPAAAIVAEATAQHANLIVAGTHSKTGFERLVLGSTAEQVIRGAECPVLTVGPKVRQPPPGPLNFSRIVFANDFSAEATKAAAYALSFAETSGAKLYCCFVLGESDHLPETREMVDEAFRKALRQRIPESVYDWCSPECVVEHGDATQAILRLAKRVDAELIVLGSRKASFWLTRIERGMTPALLAEASCPVLSIC